MFPIDDKSIPVAVIRWLSRTFRFVNPYFLTTRWSAAARHSRVFLEAYLLAWTGLIVACLLVGSGDLLRAGAWVAAYRIALLMHSRSTVFLEGGIVVLNSRAAILTVVWNVVEVVNCFALIVLCLGDRFDPPVTRPWTAVYYSTVTFFTLGYGDIHPKPDSPLAQAVVTAELWCFVFFLVMLGPLVFGLGAAHYRAGDVPGEKKA